MNPPQLPLKLWIDDCSCVCGNRWTNSTPTRLFGGTLAPQEEASGQVTNIISSRKQYNHCFRCVPLGLGIGWQAPSAASPAAPARAAAKAPLWTELTAKLSASLEDPKKVS